MNETYFYLIVAFCIVLFLIQKIMPRHKVITFIIAYWIITGSAFVIDIAVLPFDLRLNRIILIIFTAYLLFFAPNWINKNKERNNVIKSLTFEKYLYSFIFLFIVVNLIHTIKIGSLKDFIVNTTNILTFLLIYIVLKRRADRKMIEVFIKVFLVACTLSSIIGIYQFFIDPLFLRVGSLRGAFAGLFRANGIFNAEYTQAYFLIIGTFIALFIVRSKLLKYSLIGLFLMGIILTFHRMSWVVLIILAILYFIEVKRRKAWQMIAFGAFAIASIFLFYSTFVPIGRAEIVESPFVQERLLADTLTGRLSLFKMALKAIPENWLIGIGGVESDIFYDTVYSAGWSKPYALGEGGLAIHNEYILIGFFYGIPVLFLFCSFLISSLIYFWKKSKEKSKFFFLTTLYILLFIIANLSNMFPLYSHIGLLLAILLGISVAIYQKNIDVNDLILNEHIRVGKAIL